MKLVRKFRVLVLVLLLLWLAAKSGSFLVIDDPQKSDAILVLAGETDRRPARAMELFDQGYGSHVIFDVPAGARIYDSTNLQIAQNWVSTQPKAAALSVCPITGLSTKAETTDAAECLHKLGAHTVLVVTSDFHTRRAWSVFRKECPDFSFHVAASYDATQFGPQWWKHRQWAKTNVDEWLRLLWWSLVDRWW